MDKGRRRGAKPRGPFEAKRKTLTTRITDDLRERLDTAAHADDRSLSQEIEFRLRASFDFEHPLGGPRLAALWREMSAAAEQMFPGDNGWLNDYRKFAVIRTRWESILDAASPAPANPTEEKIARGDAAIRSLRARQQLGRNAVELWQAIDVLRSLFAPAEELKRLANDPDLPPEKRAEFAAAAAGSAPTSSEEIR